MSAISDPHKLEYTQWLHALQSFLNGLLQPIIPTNEDRFRLLDESGMAIWAKAFTHETYSPTDNYEELEFLGDALLETVFSKYLMKRFPHLHKKEYTELKVAYMSKMRQAEMSRQMGLGTYVRVAGLDRASLNIDADAFESFFGALDTISDMVKPGWGYINCYNAILHLYNNVSISEDLGEGSTKTQVIQMFVRFELPAPVESSYDGKPGVNVNISLTPAFVQMLRSNGYEVTSPLFATSKAPKETDARTSAAKQAVDTLEILGLIETKADRVAATGRRGVEFTVSLKKEHLDFLQENGIQITDPVIGRAIGKTKKEADYTAYANAYATLGKYGINTQWASQVKRKRDFADPAIAKYVPAAVSRSKSEGYQDIYFFIPRKTVTDEGAVVELVGIRPDGHQQALEITYTNDRSNGYREAKTLIIRKYAEFR
jgi:dsRNA-specific ribonuclease